MDTIHDPADNPGEPNVTPDVESRRRALDLAAEARGLDPEPWPA